MAIMYVEDIYYVEKATIHFINFINRIGEYYV